MRGWRPSLLTCLTVGTLTVAASAHAGGLVSPAPATVAADSVRTHAVSAWTRGFGFAQASLRELMAVRLPLGPASLLPAGWEPAATHSRTEELRRTTIELGLRHRFAIGASAQVGARITVLDCINVDQSGRWALGDGGSKVHGLIGFTYRY